MGKTAHRKIVTVKEITLLKKIYDVIHQNVQIVNESIYLWTLLTIQSYINSMYIKFCIYSL